jgi:hypothetical protein
MNRPTNTALRLAGIALALSCLGSDGGSASSDGASADSTSETVSAEEFCEGFQALYTSMGQADPKDTSGMVKAVRDWAAEVEASGPPSGLSGDAREGLEVLVSTFEGVEDGATYEELQKLGTDASEADSKKVEAFGTWTTENCTPATPSDDAS